MTSVQDTASSNADKLGGNASGKSASNFMPEKQNQNITNKSGIDLGGAS